MSGFVRLAGGEALRNLHSLLHEVLQVHSIIIDGHHGPDLRV